MAGQLRLRDYPFVVVRFACRDCSRIGRYRLAVLAERFGPDALLPDVFNAIAAACPRTRECHPGRRCQAYVQSLGNLPHSSLHRTIRRIIFRPEFQDRQFRIQSRDRMRASISPCTPGEWL
jgi:hypothetical protein